MNTVGQAIAAGAAAGGGIIAIPFGASIGPGRETSQVNGQGTVVQGMVFPVTLGNGSTTSVFVPYSQINDTAAIESLINARIAAIQAITG